MWDHVRYCWRTKFILSTYLVLFVAVGWMGLKFTAALTPFFAEVTQDANRQLLVGAAAEPKLSELERVQSLVQAIRIHPHWITLANFAWHTQDVDTRWQNIFYGWGTLKIGDQNMAMLSVALKSIFWWYNELMSIDMMWYDVIWCDMMWYDVIWCDMMWYDVIWCDM